MTNPHDTEARIARTASTLCSLVAGGLGYTGIRTYDKQRDMQASQEAGNARMATYLELTGAIFLFALGYTFHRAARESYLNARDQDAKQKIK